MNCSLICWLPLTMNFQPVTVFAHNKLDVTWHSYMPRRRVDTFTYFQVTTKPSMSEPRLPTLLTFLAVNGVAVKGKRDLAAPARYRPDAAPIWPANPQCGSY
jgi:hypothetical protein